MLLMLVYTVVVRKRVLAESGGEPGAEPLRAQERGGFILGEIGTLCQYPWPCIVPFVCHVVENGDTAKDGPGGCDEIRKVKDDLPLDKISNFRIPTKFLSSQP